MSELRHVFRRLVRRPAFWIPCVTTLSLAIGAAAGAFTVLEAIVLSPLPYPQAERLVRLETAVPGMGPGTHWGVGKAQFLYLRDQSDSFQEMALYTLSRATVGAGEGGGSAEQVGVALVSAGMVEVLGMGPALGRAPRPEDNLAETPACTWLTDGFWRRRFGADPGIVGQTIVVDGRAVEVAGVLVPAAALPEQVRFPEIHVELWMPVRLDPAQPPVASHIFRSIGRLMPGVALNVAQVEVARWTEKLPTALPEAYSENYLRKTGFATELVSLREEVTGEVAGVLWILCAAVGLVLLIACANVANLFLARTEAQRRSLGMRVVLGASRFSLAGHLLGEALLLTLFSGAVGLVLAYWGIRTLVALAPAGLPRLAEIHLDGVAVLFTLVVSVVAGVAFGLLCLARHGGVPAALGTVGRGLASSPGHRTARSVLLVAQVTLSLILLSAAALLVQSFRNLTSVRPGLDPEGVFTFRVVLPATRYGSFEAVGILYQQLARELEALPDVVSTGLTAALPFTGYDGCSALFVDDRPLVAGEQPPCISIFFVAPGYFETLGVPVRGRSPDWSDLEQRTGVVVVSEALAQRLWPGEDPLGKAARLRPDTEPYRIAGVAGDVRANGLDSPSVEVIYFPLIPSAGAELWGPLQDVAVVVRTRTKSSQKQIPALRQAVARIDPQIPLTELRSMREIIARSMARISVATLLLVVAAGMALFLSAVGIYGVLAYLTVQRRPEIGIRMALGARSGQVRWIIVLQSLRLVAIGVTLGLAGTLLLTRYLHSLLFEVSPVDPVILGTVIMFLIVLAVAASWLPAHRAARVAPVEALRQE